MLRLDALQGQFDSLSKRLIFLTGTAPNLWWANDGRIVGHLEGILSWVVKKQWYQVDIDSVAQIRLDNCTESMSMTE